MGRSTRNYCRFTIIRIAYYISIGKSVIKYIINTYRYEYRQNENDSGSYRDPVACNT